MTRGLFVTGTDTGVGKTYVAALIAKWLCDAGHIVGVYKPAASGCGRTEQSSVLQSEDALALWDAAGRPGAAGAGAGAAVAAGGGAAGAAGSAIAWPVRHLST